MNIRFVASFSPIAPDPQASRRLYVDALGLPLEGDADYVFSEAIEGVKHLGVWPLAQAAQACFGTAEWPAGVPVPQASIEFEVDDPAEAAAEVQAKGFRLLHDSRTEPWGQTIARLLSPEGLIVGFCHTPWMRT